MLHRTVIKTISNQKGIAFLALLIQLLLVFTLITILVLGGSTDILDRFTTITPAITQPSVPTVTPVTTPSGAEPTTVPTTVLTTSPTVPVTVQPTISPPDGNGTIVRVPQDYSTIQAAVNAASEGTKILVAPGTYNERVTIPKTVILEAEQFDQQNPKNNPTTINGGGGSAVLTINGGNPTIRGFKLLDGNDVIYPTTLFTLEYNYLSEGSDLIDYEEGSGGICRGNFFENAGDDAIDLDHQTRDLLIENNRIVNSDDDGIEIRLQDDDIPSQITITIRNNHIEGSGEDGIQFIDYSNDTNRLFKIERNLILNSVMAGIGLMDNENTTEDLRAASITEPIWVYNNTFVNNDHGISGGDSLVAVNNIFAGHRLALKNVDGNSAVSHSLFFNNTSDQQGSNMVVNTSVQGDPRFDTNYGLLTGSPAIDRGVAQFIHRGQAIFNYAVGQYSGSAPDLGFRES